MLSNEHKLHWMWVHVILGTLHYVVVYLQFSVNYFVPFFSVCTPNDPCQNRGTCDEIADTCRCLTGYIGELCNECKLWNVSWNNYNVSYHTISLIFTHIRHGIMIYYVRFATQSLQRRACLTFKTWNDRHFTLDTNCIINKQTRFPFGVINIM